MTMVKEIMSSSPVTIHVDQSLAEAAFRMREAGVGALFAVDGDELVGVVTDRDLVTRCIARGLEPLTVPVIDAMTRHVVYCHEHCPVIEAAALMTQQQTRRLAVVDDDLELIGVLSLGDIARTAIEEAILAVLVMREICVPTPTAKRPGREDPTGGRRRGSPAGVLHVYAPRPCIRRRPFSA